MLLHYRNLQATALLAAIVVIGLSAVSSVSAEGPAKAVDWSELPYASTVDKFVEAIEDRDIGTAIDTLGWTEESAARMTKPLAEVVALGPHDGHEIVAVRRMSPRLHQVLGILHYAQKPVLFSFYLRQFKEKWLIQTVNFGDDLRPLEGVAPLERVSETKGSSKVAVQLH